MASFFAPIEESGVTEIVGINEQIDQNDYSKSVEIPLTVSGARPQSGFVIGVVLVSTEDGSGAVMVPACELYFFDSDPTVAAGATSITAADWVKCIGKIDIAAADWNADATGAVVSKSAAEVMLAFHEVNSLFVVMKNIDATAINSAAGDDEQIEFNVLYQLVS